MSGLSSYKVTQSSALQRKQQMPIAGRQQRFLRELLPAGIFFIGMAQELLHEMQEKFPIFILLAAGLLDLSGE